MENETMMLMNQLPEEKRSQFLMMVGNDEKKPSTALILCLFLGGFGAHHFYLGNTLRGVLHLVFIWTFIPAIVSFFELFFVGGWARDYNRKKANEAFMLLKGS